MKPIYFEWIRYLISDVLERQWGMDISAFLMTTVIKIEKDEPGSECRFFVERRGQLVNRTGDE